MSRQFHVPNPHCIIQNSHDNLLKCPHSKKKERLQRQQYVVKMPPTTGVKRAGLVGCRVSSMEYPRFNQLTQDARCVQNFLPATAHQKPEANKTTVSLYIVAISGSRRDHNKDSSHGIHSTTYLVHGMAVEKDSSGKKKKEPNRYKGAGLEDRFDQKNQQTIRIKMTKKNENSNCRHIRNYLV